MSRDFDLARERLPLERLAAEHGRDLSACPVCRAAAALVENGRFDDGWLAGLRASADLVGLLERLTGRPLQKEGAGFKTVCPACGGKLTTYRKGGQVLAKCWGQQGGCAVKGDALAVLMRAGGLEFPEAVEELAKDMGRPVQYAGAGKRTWLKCSRAGCVANAAPLDEVGFLAVVMGLDPAKKSDRGQAAVAYLQQAGITRGERLAPSVMPGQSRRAGDWEVADPEPPQSAEAPGAEPEAERAGEEDFTTAEPVPAVPPEAPVPAGDPPPEAHSEPPGNPLSLEPALEPDAASGGGDNLEGPLVDLGADLESGGRVAVTSDEVRDALRWFYERMEWREAEGEEMERRRGLEPATQRVLGYRSNQRSNRALLEQAAKSFSVAVCIAAGLWVRGGGDTAGADEERRAGPKPSPYYHGLGRVGERKVERNGKVEKIPEFGWNEPPIIPYWECLPPADGSGPVAYRQAVVTEGEFKGGALWQLFARDAWRLPAMPVDRLLLLRPHKHYAEGAGGLAYLTPPGNGTLGVAAVPGISYWKKSGGAWLCQHLLRTWLQRTGVRDLFVVYDNEDRSKKRAASRHDTVVSALLLGRDVARELGITARFAQLPRWLRDAQGKADWDGALAELRAYADDHPQGRPPASPADLHEWRRKRSSGAAPAAGPEDEAVDWEDCVPAEEFRERMNEEG